MAWQDDGGPAGKLRFLLEDLQGTDLSNKVLAVAELLHRLSNVKFGGKPKPTQSI